jgi:hypothetical protein
MKAARVATRRRGRAAAAALAIAVAIGLAGCDTPPKPGFSGPGCYNVYDILEPAIATEIECKVLGYEWRVHDARRVEPKAAQ